MKPHIGKPLLSVATAQPAPVQDFKSLRDQGMTESSKSYVDNKMIENDSLI